MATGFVQRFKGKIKAAVIDLDAALTSGLFLKAGASFVKAGQIWTNAGAPVSGGSGTLANYALPGDLLTDTTNKVLYQNTNTSASPTWTAVREVSGNFNAAGLTSVTSVSNQQTPTTGGVTLANQTLAAGAVWRVKAYGTYTAASSATARNAEFSCFWGSTQLTKVTSVVLASTAQTTGWDVEFTLTASSTTALWLAGRLIEQSDVALTTTAADLDYIIVTATSNTGLSTGPQTLDFRVDTSASVVGDAVQVHSVIMERLL